MGHTCAKLVAVLVCTYSLLAFNDVSGEFVIETMYSKTSNCRIGRSNFEVNKATK